MNDDNVIIELSEQWRGSLYYEITMNPFSHLPNLAGRAFRAIFRFNLPEYANRREA